MSVSHTVSPTSQISYRAVTEKWHPHSDVGPQSQESLNEEIVRLPKWSSLCSTDLMVPAV